MKYALWYTNMEIYVNLDFISTSSLPYTYIIAVPVSTSSIAYIMLCESRGPGPVTDITLSAGCPGAEELLVGDNTCAIWQLCHRQDKQSTHRVRPDKTWMMPIERMSPMSCEPVTTCPLWHLSLAPHTTFQVALTSPARAGDCSCPTNLPINK